MRRLLLALLLTFPLLADVYWVKYDELADAVGTVNTYADPYGVQAAFDAAADGDVVKVIQDPTNKYDSGTNSWTNRNGDGSISTGNNGTVDAPLLVSCWSDETTQVTTTGGCEFDFTTGTGDGFSIAHDYVLWRNIKASNAAAEGWDVAWASVYNFFYRCWADNNGATGFKNMSQYAGPTVESIASNNTTVGFVFASPTRLILSESYGNADGVEAYTGVGLIGNLIYSNTDDGVVMAGDSVFLMGNTFYANGDENAYVWNAGVEMLVLVNNLFTDSVGGWGLLSDAAGAGFWLVEGNNYYNNDAGTRNLNGAPIHVDNDSTPDEGAVSYVSATDLEVSSGGALSITFPRGTTEGAGKKGAVQSAAAAGATSYASAQ